MRIPRNTLAKAFRLRGSDIAVPCIFTDQAEGRLYIHHALGILWWQLPLKREGHSFSTPFAFCRKQSMAHPVEHQTAIQLLQLLQLSTTRSDEQSSLQKVFAVQK